MTEIRKSTGIDEGAALLNFFDVEVVFYAFREAPYFKRSTYVQVLKVEVVHLY